jgi:hypothetical protein
MDPDAHERGSLAGRQQLTELTLELASVLHSVCKREQRRQHGRERMGNP